MVADLETQPISLGGIPRWLLYPFEDRKIDKPLKRGGTKKARLERLVSNHNELVEEFLNTLQAPSDIKDEIREILSDTSYINNLYGNLAPDQQKILLKLAVTNIIGVPLQQNINTYLKLDGGSLNNTLKFEKYLRDPILNKAKKIKNFIRGASKSKELVYIDYKAVDRLLYYGVNLSGLDARIEQIVMHALPMEVTKGDLFNYLRNQNIKIMESDQNVPEKEKANKLAEMVLDNPVYLKPKDGARGSLVTQLKYENGKLYVKSEDRLVHNLLRIGNNEEYIIIARSQNNFELDKNFNTKEVKYILDDLLINIQHTTVNISTASQDSGPIGILFIIEDVSSVIERLGKEIPEEELEEYIENGYEVNNIPLQGYKLNFDDKNTTTIDVSLENLPSVINAVRGVYETLFTECYGETKIDTPLIRNGVVSEIRAINQAVDLENPRVTAMYAKIGSGNIVANISVNGSGEYANQAVRELYSVLRPGLNANKREKLVKQYLENVKNSAVEVTKAIGNYLTDLKNEYIPNFPLEKITVTDCSTDFMAHIVEKDGSKYLTPVLMDVNFHYGYSGVRNEFDSHKINLGKRIIESKTLKLIKSDKFIY